MRKKVAIDCYLVKQKIAVVAYTADMHENAWFLTAGLAPCALEPLLDLVVSQRFHGEKMKYGVALALRGIGEMPKNIGGFAHVSAGGM